MAKHQGLGRGLDALMSDEEEIEQENSFSGENQQNNSPSENQTSSSISLPKGITQDDDGTLWVNPSLLKPNPRQPRVYFDEEKLAELTESIKEHGVLIPIIIEDAGDGSFYIIAGERRIRAARGAGLEKVPVQLRKYSDSAKLEVALIENIQRTDLNPIEEATAYFKIMELNSITQEEVSKRVGKSRAAVANSVRLLKLPEDMQRSLASGEISPGHARALLSVVNPADQRVLFGRLMGQGLSVREAEQLAQEMNGGGRAVSRKTSEPKTDSRDPNYVSIEQQFIDKFGTKVKLSGNFDKGTITIDYFTKDDLDRIYNIIIGNRG